MSAISLPTPAGGVAPEPIRDPVLEAIAVSKVYRTGESEEQVHYREREQHAGVDQQLAVGITNRRGCCSSVIRSSGFSCSQARPAASGTPQPSGRR